MLIEQSVVPFIAAVLTMFVELSLFLSYNVIKSLFTVACERIKCIFTVTGRKYAIAEIAIA